VVVTGDDSAYRRLEISDDDQRTKIKKEFEDDFTLLRKVMASSGKKLLELRSHRITEDDL